MTKHLALDESALTEPALLPLHMRIARSISIILSPIVISLPLIALVAFYHERNRLMALLYTAITLLFTSIGPLLYILVGVRRGKFSDMDVSMRSQRSGPFLFTILSALVALFMLAVFHGPRDLDTLLLIMIVSGVVMMMTTFWWKISIHTSSLASAATILTALYGVIMLPLFVLVALVGWSRVVLRRHTIAQVIAGSVLSTILATVILLLRGV